MGQYYMPASIEKDESVYSHDYGNGLKLMEHSYVGNEFVNAVKSLLIPGGRWYKNHFVWTGDYADCLEHASDSCDKGGENGCPNIFDLVHENNINPDPENFDAKRFHFLVNHSQMEYIDYDELCITDAEMAKEEHPFDDVESGFVIDPLPLLTCEGNGRGGGDFRGHDDRVGMWARDIISIEETAPAGYEQIDGCFKE